MGADPCESMAQIVVKATKYCNLRCSYCYEYEELHDKRRMSSENIGNMYKHIMGWAIDRNVTRLQFIWHGGEPLLMPLDFYQEAKALQDDAFQDKIAVANTLQSNLTILTEKHIAFLKQGDFIKDIGVSFDVYGQERIDVGGASRTPAVLRNMQRLVDNEISFGAICVLARGTRPHVRQIYRFFDQLGVSVRFLPFFETGAAWQEDRHALSNSEIAAALIEVFEEWLTSSVAVPTAPVEHYLEVAINFIAGKRALRFSRRVHENVFVVNTDGNVWGEPELYESEFVYGNIFNDDLQRLLRSPGREKAVAASESRQATFCAGCPYFKNCSGYFMASNLAYEVDSSTAYQCVARLVVDYIVDWLNRSTMRDEIIAAHANSTIGSGEVNL
jgi:uncharacterized protein